MIECIDGGVIDWGVDHIRSRRLQLAWEALLDAYADMDTVGVMDKGSELVATMIDVINAEAVERAR